jgi:hypothetical protein
LNTPLKIKVKYWYEFLRLAHQSQEPEVIDNLKKDTYEKWGNYLNLTFDEWWKKYSNLFKEPSSIKRLTVKDKIQDNVFTIQFPFTYPSTTAAKIFKEMYEREFEEQRTVKRKLKKVYGGSFSLTVDDLKVDRFRYYLLYAQKVYIPLLNSQTKITTKDFIKKAEIKFAKIKKVKKSSEKSTIPFQTSSNVYENQSRNARRYNTYCENLILNVSKGLFPGEYEKSKHPVLVVKKPRVERVGIRLRGVPRSKYENFKHRKNPLDPHSTRAKRRKEVD